MKWEKSTVERVCYRFEYLIKESGCPNCKEMTIIIRTSPFSMDYRCMACLALLTDGITVKKGG